MPSQRWSRIILHADMDAFYAAVEQRDDPALRGKPVIVGGTGNRGVVSTASYEARPFGVHSAMPMVQARRLCPHAIVLPPDFARYRAASQAIMAVFGSYSPLVEPLSLDEAFLDMTGSERLFGPPREMGERIKRDVAEATGGLTVSIGAATTKFVAKVASDLEKPDSLVLVPPEATLDLLWPLPVSRLWGVGPRTQERLERLGLATIGDVARLDRSSLCDSLGSLGEHIWKLANADDPREVVPEREARSVGAEYTLEHDVVGEPAIRHQLQHAADKVARRLRSKGLLASAVRVKLKTSDFKLLTHQAAVSHPTDVSGDLLGAAVALLRRFDLTQPYRLVGIAAFDLTDSVQPVQGELFPDAVSERSRRLDQALDTVAERFGGDAVKRGSDL
jgi:DNA polymerase-4